MRHALQREGQNQADRVEEVEPHDNLDDPPKRAAGDALGEEETDVEQQDGELCEEHARAGDHLEILECLDVSLVFGERRVFVVHCHGDS